MSPAGKLFLKIGSSIQDASQSQIFGWPCFKIGKTAFVSFENDCMILKLPPSIIEDAIQLDGTYIFMPNKKTAMKN